jgi:hypothetical protein
MLAASLAKIDSNGDWIRAHEALSRWAKDRAAADAEDLLRVSRVFQTASGELTVTGP